MLRNNLIFVIFLQYIVCTVSPLGPSLHGISPRRSGGRGGGQPGTQRYFRRRRDTFCACFILACFNYFLTRGQIVANGL